MSNTYDLQIKTNFYKALDQFEGNGVHGEYIDGCFSNGLDFLVYPFRSLFYLWVGRGKEKKMIRTERVSGYADFDLYHRDPDTFFKYADRLLDWYNENCLECTDCSTTICEECLQGKERF